MTLFAVIRFWSNGPHLGECTVASTASQFLQNGFSDSLGSSIPKRVHQHNHWLAAYVTGIGYSHQHRLTKDRKRCDTDEDRGDDYEEGSLPSHGLSLFIGTAPSLKPSHFPTKPHGPPLLQPEVWIMYTGPVGLMSDHSFGVDENAADPSNPYAGTP